MSEFIVYTDESDKTGIRFSNFYGGSLVQSSERFFVEEVLRNRKQELNFHGEIKWVKVTANYLDKYLQIMDTFFNLVKNGKVKIRIMFTDNTIVPIALSSEQRENEFLLLYYQFIKHGFGLKYAGRDDPTRIRLYLDRLPDTKERISKFKAYLSALSRSPEFRHARILIDPEQIAEVDSHNHVILQCTDIVLGAMAFRLNDKHLVKPDGARIRGKKTRAKEALYKHINAKIREIYPNFRAFSTHP
ncbi:MAG: DUF3800 domain-containing protein [Phycisphaeraceae bacterium]